MREGNEDLQCAILLSCKAEAEQPQAEQYQRARLGHWDDCGFGVTNVPVMHRPHVAASFIVGILTGLVATTGAPIDISNGRMRFATSQTKEAR